MLKVNNFAFSILGFVGSIFLLSACGNTSPGSGLNNPNNANTFSGTCNPAGTPFGSGSGTQAAPYQVCSLQHLYNMGDPNYSASYFIQMSNLDLSNQDFVSLPSFSGTFDGNKFVIANLTASASFISDNTGVLKNVVLVNANVAGNTRSGALVGTNQNNGQIVQCSVTGNMVGTYDSIGGLVGYNWGQISRSSAANSVTGQDSTGGLVGTNRGSITNSEATGAVNGQMNIGGLVGNNYGTVTNSLSIGHVPTSGTNIGGLVGLNQASGVATSSYWNINTSGTSTSQAGTGATTAQMQSSTLYVGWEFATIWAPPSAGAYPTLR